MSNTVLDTAILYRCTTPREKLLELIEVADGDIDCDIAEALGELRWQWDLDHRDEPGAECPYPHVVLLNGELFEVRDFSSDEPLDFSRVIRRPDGGFDFVGLYYNGGASWEEVAAEALAELMRTDPEKDTTEIVHRICERLDRLISDRLDHLISCRRLEAEAESQPLFAYLSEEDSALYAKVMKSDDSKDRQIKRILEEKAAASRASHAACRR